MKVQKRVQGCLVSCTWAWCWCKIHGKVVIIQRSCRAPHCARHGFCTPAQVRAPAQRMKSLALKQRPSGTLHAAHWINLVLAAGAGATGTQSTGTCRADSTCFPNSVPHACTVCMVQVEQCSQPTHGPPASCTSLSLVLAIRLVSCSPVPRGCTWPASPPS